MLSREVLIEKGSAMKYADDGASPYYKFEFLDYVEYKNEIFRREENIFDFGNHIIKWDKINTDKNNIQEGIMIHYYSNNSWSNSNHIMDKNEPAPELEKMFKKHIRNKRTIQSMIQK